MCELVALRWRDVRWSERVQDRHLLELELRRGDHNAGPAGGAVVVAEDGFILGGLGRGERGRRHAGLDRVPSGECRPLPAGTRRQSPTIRMQPKI